MKSLPNQQETHSDLNRPSVATPLKRSFMLSQLQTHIDKLQTFNLHSLELFGSVARDEASSSSDLDFLVEFDGPVTFDGYMDLKFFLEDLFKCPVDLVTKRSIKAQVSRSIAEEAIRVA